MGLKDHTGLCRRRKNRASWTGGGEKNTADEQRHRGEDMGWRNEKENNRVRGERWRDTNMETELAETDPMASYILEEKALISKFSGKN